MKKALLLLALVIASAFGSGLFALAEAGALPEYETAAAAPVFLENGAMAVVDLDRGEAIFTFAAPSGSVYDVWLFPASEDAPRVRAQLWREGRLVAEGEGGMPALSLRLAAGAVYALHLEGQGRVRLEIARHALSRCFDEPLELNARGDIYAKAFAREGDVHWYAVDAADERPLALVGVPAEDSVRLTAMLFDDGGHLLAEGTQTAGGACLMDFTPKPERRYAMVSPEGAGGILVWESSEPSVARVEDDGTVTGVGVGTARITAYAAGGESDSCQVEVRRVSVTGIDLLSNRVALNVGDDTSIECEVLPANASDPTLRYEARPEGIVEIDRRGVLRAIAEGEATVTVRALDGGFTDAMTVKVGPAPPRHRALLVGEQNYAATVAAVRTGSINSVSGLRRMLENLSFDGSKVQVSTLLDASRDGVLAAIKSAFSEAGDADVSLFYITCHGYYAGGMTCLQMYDGSVLTAAELAGALRNLRGELLVIIDCCGSGGVLARASYTGDILKGIDAVFCGTVGPPVMATSRFQVLASAALEQDSYRVSFGETASESGMSTVFARALCEAGGWNIDRAARSAMRADLDYDGRVTLTELYNYTARRVMWVLELTGELTDAGGRYVQSVQVWPEGDGTVVFQR